jgi:hypothetical protein
MKIKILKIVHFAIWFYMPTMVFLLQAYFYDKYRIRIPNDEKFTLIFILLVFFWGVICINLDYKKYNDKMKIILMSLFKTMIVAVFEAASLTVATTILIVHYGM